MKYQNIKLSELLKKDEDQTLVLPNFQREFVWTRDKQKKMLSSFVVDAPINSILIITGKKNDFAARRLSFEGSTTPSTVNCEYLLDGQQRISCLKSIFSDPFVECKDKNLSSKGKKDKFSTIWDSLFAPLQNRWFFRITANGNNEKLVSEEDDIFGYLKLRFDKDTFNKRLPDEVIDHLVCKRIFKKKTSDWFHPLSKLNLGEAKQKVAIAEKASSELLIPLWDLHKPSSRSKSYKSVHEYTLKSIADHRLLHLKAECEGSKEKIVELLGEELYEELDALSKTEKELENKIEQALVSLTADWVANIKLTIEEICNYFIPQTKLGSDEISRAISIFENINSGGTPLSLFDLIVARAASSARNEVSLADRIKEEIEDEISVPSKALKTSSTPAKIDCTKLGFLEDKKDNSSLSKNFKYQFLNTLSIYSHVREEISLIKTDHIKQKKQQELDHTQINRNYLPSTKALKRAVAFLHIRCGIIQFEKMSYRLMIIPIALAFSYDKFWKSRKACDRIEYWYWSSLLGGAYREGQNATCVKDVRDLIGWLQGSQNPFKERQERVLAVPEYSEESILLMKFPIDNMTIPSAVHDGILQYVLSTEPKDLLPNTYENIHRLNTWNIHDSGYRIYKDKKKTGEGFEYELNDHHILPLASTTKIGESSKKLRTDKSHILNSVLNRTLISSKANSLISNKKPGEYFKYMDPIAIGNHFIPENLEQFYPDPTSTESDQTKKYEAMLKRRYKLISRGLKEELEKLIDS